MESLETNFLQMIEFHLKNGKFLSREHCQKAFKFLNIQQLLTKIEKIEKFSFSIFFFSPNHLKNRCNLRFAHGVFSLYEKLF